MKPYRIDFVNGRGHEMTLDREGGIRRSDLDELEINMLKSQRVPCLLPLEWVEMDGNVTFRYALNGKKMLLHKLQQQPLTMEQFYGLLLRVVSALMECKDYMLRPEGCMLGDTFLFVGERFEDLSLVYVPLNSRREESALGDDLLAMVARWTAYVDQVDGEGLRTVLGLLGGNRWPLAELRELLLEVLASKQIKPAERMREDVVPEYRMEEPRHRGTDGYAPLPESELRVSESPQSVRMSGHGSELREAEQVLDQQEGMTAANKPAGSRRWILGLAFALGTACIWRFVYLNNATAQTMLISLGLTVLLLAGTVLLWRKGASLLVGQGDPEEAEREFAGSLELQSGPLHAQDRWRKPAFREHKHELRTEEGTTSSLGNYALPEQPSKASIAKTSAIQSLLAPTTLLSDNDGNDAEGGHAEAARAVLKRSWNGQEEDIPLPGDVFQIGRGSGGKGYEEKADGVSRLHLEIVKEQGCHVAKDLGSRNGSLLNGTMMIPYKSYPLATGDTIQLSGTKGPSYQFIIS